MKILLVTDSYPPEIRSASHLMLELAEEFYSRGHRVTVMTTWPEYNLDQNSNLQQFAELEDEGAIQVLRIKTLPHHNVNYIVRGIAQLLMPLQFFWKAQQHRLQADAVIVYSPPLPLALVGVWLGTKARFLLNVQDLFPQNAIDLGVLRNPWQIKFFRWLEGYAYRNADLVTVHSEGNRSLILQHYPELANKLQILHNWVDVGHHYARTATVDFRVRWKITQRYIAIFAGVMGPSQYLERVLEVAERVQEQQPHLLFLLVGDGVEKSKLIKLATQKNLSNVQFEEFIGRDVYPDLLEICSLGLVCLSPQNQTPVVPGKILGYMAAGLPVVAFLQSQSDGHGIIQKAECGITADSSNLEECVGAFQEMLKQADKFEDIGAAGRNYATQHFSKEACVSEIERILTSTQEPL
jgi:glycosyltransferase involved in cell wall biosynthesis